MNTRNADETPQSSAEQNSREKILDSFTSNEPQKNSKKIHWIKDEIKIDGEIDKDKISDYILNNRIKTFDQLLEQIFPYRLIKDKFYFDKEELKAFKDISQMDHEMEIDDRRETYEKLDKIWKEIEDSQILNPSDPEPSDDDLEENPPKKEASPARKNKKKRDESYKEDSENYDSESSYEEVPKNSDFESRDESGNESVNESKISRERLPSLDEFRSIQVTADYLADIYSKESFNELQYGFIKLVDGTIRRIKNVKNISDSYEFNGSSYKFEVWASSLEDDSSDPYHINDISNSKFDKNDLNYMKDYNGFENVKIRDMAKKLKDLKDSKSDPVKMRRLNYQKIINGNRSPNFMSHVLEEHKEALREIQNLIKTNRENEELLENESNLIKQINEIEGFLNELVKPKQRISRVQQKNDSSVFSKIIHKLSQNKKENHANSEQDKSKENVHINQSSMLSLLSVSDEDDDESDGIDNLIHKEEESYNEKS